MKRIPSSIFSIIDGNVPNCMSMQYNLIKNLIQKSIAAFTQYSLRRSVATICLLLIQSWWMILTKDSRSMPAANEPLSFKRDLFDGIDDAICIEGRNSRTRVAIGARFTEFSILCCTHKFNTSSLRLELTSTRSDLLSIGAIFGTSTCVSLLSLLKPAAHVNSWDGVPSGFSSDSMISSSSWVSLLESESTKVVLASQMYWNWGKWINKSKHDLHQTKNHIV